MDKPKSKTLEQILNECEKIMAGTAPDFTAHICLALFLHCPIHEQKAALGYMNDIQDKYFGDVNVSRKIFGEMVKESIGD